MWNFTGGSDDHTLQLLSRIDRAREKHSYRFADIDDELFKVLWDLAQSSCNDLVNDLNLRFPLGKMEHEQKTSVWEGDWSVIFRQSLGQYSSGLNLELNEFLRHIEFHAQQRKFAHVVFLSFVSTRSIVTPRPLTVYRGMNLYMKPKPSKYAKYIEDDVALYYKEFKEGYIGSNGFWSTTTDPKVAAKFVGNSVKDQQVGLLCIINLPSGFPIYPLLQSSYGTREKEILLPLCVRFKIEDVLVDEQQDNSIVLVFLKPILKGDVRNYSLLNDKDEEVNIQKLLTVVPDIALGSSKGMDEGDIDELFEYCRNAKRTMEDNF
jgi:hypothetical protein